VTHGYRFTRSFRKMRPREREIYAALTTLLADHLVRLDDNARDRILTETRWQDDGGR
jgi:hypothetical protein